MHHSDDVLSSRQCDRSYDAGRSRVLAIHVTGSILVQLHGTGFRWKCRQGQQQSWLTCAEGGAWDSSQPAIRADLKDTDKVGKIRSIE
jgi:hypothetical protein